MKWGLSIVGIVLILFGSLWTLQGMNIVRNSFMTGKIQYAILGIVTLTLIVFLPTGLAGLLRRRAAAGRASD